MDAKPAFYVGKAASDQLRGTGWFVGDFVPPEFGLRHQTDIELKWGVHEDGAKRAGPIAYARATTISVLVHGTMHLKFGVGALQESVTLREQGDYVIFGPGIMHSWEAVGETVVLTVRFRPGA